MSILTRKPKPDPAVTYQAVIGFAYADAANPTSVRRGTRLKGDHPIVRATFGPLWAADDLDDEELARRRGAVNAWTLPPTEPAPEPVRLMRALEPVNLGPGGSPGAWRRFDIGAELPSTHEAVLRFPESFELVG